MLVGGKRPGFGRWPSRAAAGWQDLKEYAVITDRDLAEEYANLFGLEPRRQDVSGATFRERVARTLHAQGQPIYAQEALVNDRLGHDPFAFGSLDRGDGDTSIRRTAERTQTLLEREL
jgi:hypothetical protein